MNERRAMQILIDTNILIHLEDNRIVDEKFSRFYRFAISNNCKILYHPLAIPNDLQKDTNIQRREITLSKLKKYETLQDYAQPTAEFLAMVKNTNSHDAVDNLQLYQLYKGYVDYFVTEDLGIHQNAKRVNLEHNVMTVSAIDKVLKEKFTITIPSHPILLEQSIRAIADKFSSPFFDSLRKDYVEFDQWLDKCVKENRKCYTLQVDDEIRALLIYNIEQVEDHKIEGVYEPALKICTLKVADTAFGIKLGELFLQKMFEYCIEQKINYLYITSYEKQIHLINLLSSFGFEKQKFVNSAGNEEMRMVKCMNPTGITTPLNTQSIHPYYHDNSAIEKYVIPIRPEFYSTLFKDGRFREPTLFDKTEDSLNEIQGNTIVKAYISNSRQTLLKQGDLLFFYASHSQQLIEPIGILESIQVVKDKETLWQLVQKKTVFSPEELEEMLKESGKLNVIIFRLVTYLKKPIKLNKIKQVKSFKNKIQTITHLSEDDYIQLKNEGYFDGRYIIN